MAPRDGSYRVRDWVRAAAPRYPLRTEYRRGRAVKLSEVVRPVAAGSARGLRSMGARRRAAQAA